MTTQTKKSTYTVLQLDDNLSVRTQSKIKSQAIVHHIEIGNVFDLIGGKTYRLSACGYDLGKFTKKDFQILTHYCDNRNNHETTSTQPIHQPLPTSRTSPAQYRDSEPTEDRVVTCELLPDSYPAPSGSRNVTRADGQWGLSRHQETECDIGMVYKYYFPDSTLEIEDSEDAIVALGFCIIREQQLDIEREQHEIARGQKELGERIKEHQAEQSELGERIKEFGRKTDEALARFGTERESLENLLRYKSNLESEVRELRATLERRKRDQRP